jgi:hypothetical protein
MIALLLLAGLAQAADLLTFAPAVARYGSALESNPVMAAAYDAGGIWGAAAFKGGAFLLAVLAVYAMQGAGAQPWIVNTVMGLILAIGLFGAITNVWALSL